MDSGVISESVEEQVAMLLHDKAKEKPQIVKKSLVWEETLWLERRTFFSKTNPLLH